MTAGEIAETLDMALSTVSGMLTRIGLGKLGRIGLEPAQRYERARPGELTHIDVKKLGRIQHGYGKRITGTGRRHNWTTQTDPARRRRLQVGWECVHVCIDDATRLADVEVLADEKAVTAAGLLRRAVAHFAHFSSKEDLVASVLADQLRAQHQSLDDQPSDRAGLEAFVRSYPSPEHRDHSADGCPSAALLDEIARRPVDTREVFTDEVMGVIGDIASRLDPADAEAARADALTASGLMIGTLQLARALTDRDLSDRLLDQGVERALKMLDDSAR
jgi:TetR/AcrR family transcriptional regulator, transcriptional repressor for nem operon